MHRVNIYQTIQDQMDTSKKLCLKWKDFQENINTAFGSLRDNHDFADVTLACDEGQQVIGHKFILASSSPVFRDILKTNKHAYTFIYMRGVKLVDLVAIMDFLYFEKSYILQDNLEGFLSIAEELGLKGLTGETNEVDLSETLPVKGQENATVDDKQDKVALTKATEDSVYYINDIKTEPTIAAANIDFVGDFQDLDIKIKSLMTFRQKTQRESGRFDKVYSCNFCGKEGQQTQTECHIEANYVDGISIPCSFCKRTFKTRKGLRHHESEHKKNVFGILS